MYGQDTKPRKSFDEIDHELRAPSIQSPSAPKPRKSFDEIDQELRGGGTPAPAPAPAPSPPRQKARSTIPPGPRYDHPSDGTHRGYTTNYPDEPSGFKSPVSMDFRAPTEADKLVGRAQVASGQVAPPPIRRPARNAFEQVRPRTSPVEQVQDEQAAQSYRQATDTRPVMEKLRDPAPRAVRTEQPPEQPNWVQDKVARFGRSAVGTIPGAISGTAKLADAMYGGLQRITGNRLPEAADWSPVVSPPMESAQRGIEESLPIDPARNEDWSSKIASGLGSAAGFGKIGAATRAIGAPFKVGIGAAGVGLGADEIANEMKQAGFRRELDPARYDRAVMMGGATGLSELVGLGRTLEKFGLKRAVLQRGVEVLENSGQEGFQQWMANVNAANVGQYDKDRAQSKGVLEAVILGGIVSGGVQAADLATQAAQPATIPQQLANRTLANQNAAIRAERAPLPGIRPTVSGPTQITPITQAARVAQPATPTSAIDPTVSTLKLTEPQTANIAAESQPSALPRLPARELTSEDRFMQANGMKMPAENRINAMIEKADKLMSSENESDQKLGQRMMNKALTAVRQSDGYLAEAGQTEGEKPFTNVRAAIEGRLSSVTDNKKQSKPVTGNTDVQSFNNAALGAKMNADEAVKSGNWEAARDHYKSAMDALTEVQKIARRTKNADLVTNTGNEKSAVNTLYQSAKTRASQMAKQANAPTAGLPQKSQRSISEIQSGENLQKPQPLISGIKSGETGIPQPVESTTPSNDQWYQSLPQKQRDILDLRWQGLRPSAIQRQMKGTAYAEITKIVDEYNQRGKHQPVESAPLLRPEAVQNPEGGIPQVTSEANAHPKTAQDYLGNVATHSESSVIKKGLANREADMEESERLLAKGSTLRTAQGVEEERRQLAEYKQEHRDILEQQEVGANYDEIAAEVDSDTGGLRRPAKSFDEIAAEVETEFTPDTADLQQVREFGRREAEDEGFTEEPPTAPLTRQAEPTAKTETQPRTSLRAETAKGEYGKLSEYTRRRATEGKSLAGNAELRKLLDLREMPPYNNPETGKTAEWGDAAQETLDALAVMAGFGKQRSSELGVEGLRDAWKALQKKARSRGARISPELEDAFVWTATQYRIGFLEPYMRLHENNQAVADVYDQIEEIYSNGQQLSRQQQKDFKAVIVAEAVKGGLKEHFVDNTLWPQILNAGRNYPQQAREASREGNASDVQEVATKPRSDQGNASAQRVETKPTEPAPVVKDSLTTPPVKDGDSVTWQRDNKTESGKVTKINGPYVTAETADGETITRDKSKFTVEAQPKMREQKATGFFSQLERVIERKMPAKASGAQVRAIITNPQSGVKPDEIKWTGLDDYLRGKETVTKAEVQEFLKANEVEVTEVEMGGSKKKISDDEAVARLKRGEPVYWHPSENGEPVQMHDVASIRSEESAYKDDVESGIAYWASGSKDTKFGQYTTPGAKEGSYRELLLTLPSKRTVDPKITAVQVTNNNGGKDFQILVDGKEWIEVGDRDESSAIQRATRLWKEGHADTAQYKDPHFDEPNIVAWIRFNERTDSQGRRVMHVDEFQSGWGQEGRKKGFAGQEELPEGYSIRLDKSDGTFSIRDDDGRPVDGRDYKTENDARRGLLGIVGMHPSSIPDAPFVGSTEKWLGLAFKRALRYASENGYEAMTWTTGEQQADRYDLSKHFKEIAYAKVADHYDIEGIDINGKKHSIGSKPASELPDVVGKELADRIISGEGRQSASRIVGGARGAYVFEGLDLKVDDAQMKAFYDQILTAVVNRIGRKWKVKVEEAKIAADQKQWKITPPSETVDGDWMVKNGSDPQSKGLHFKTEAEAKRALAGKVKTVTVHSIPITDAMRESVMQGQALFQQGQSAPSAADILSDTKIQFKSGKRGQAGTLYANENALNVLQAAYQEIFGRSNVGNVNLNSSAARDVAQFLMTEANTPGLDAATGRKLREVSREFNSAWRAGKTVSIVSTAAGRKFSDIKVSRRHELFHDAQEGLNNSRGFLAKHRHGQKMIDHLADLGYAPEDRTVEAAAFIAGGQAKDFGLTNEQGNEFLEDYFNDIVEKNGAAALNQFVSVAPHAVETLKKARQKYGIGLHETTGTKRSRADREREIGRPGKDDRAAREGERVSSQTRRQEEVEARSPRTRESVENSPEFKRWFGDSVVTENGKAGGTPLRVYHGTTSGFDAFDNTKPGSRGTMASSLFGHFFSGQPDIASQYASEVTDKKEGANVIPVYLSLKDPYVLAGVDHWDYMSDTNKARRLKEHLEEKGYDGIVIRSGAGDEYVAFKPEQIKSVFNRGTFDPKSPKIHEHKDTRASFGSLANEPTKLTTEQEKRLSDLRQETGYTRRSSPAPTVFRDLPTLADRQSLDRSNSQIKAELDAAINERDALASQKQEHEDYLEKQNTEKWEKARQDGRIAFIRFGAPPVGGRSRNSGQSFNEDGVSVYEVINHGGNKYEMRPDVTSVLGFAGNVQSRPVYLVEGDVVGRGSDGEPVINVGKSRPLRGGAEIWHPLFGWQEYGRKRVEFKVGELENEPTGEVLGAFPGNLQKWLGSSRPKTPAAPTKPDPVPADWNQKRWTKKAMDALTTRDMPKEDRDKFFDFSTKKPERLALLQKYMPPKTDIDALMAVIDKADKAAKSGDGGALYDVLIEATDLLNKKPPKWGMKRIGYEAGHALSLPRALQSSSDISAILRQGAILSLPPTQWGKAAKATVRMFQAFSTAKFKEISKAINLHPDAADGRKAGLFISTDKMGLINKKEEDFISNWADKIPIVKHSEQAYKTYLDSLRMDSFARYKKSIDKTKRLSAEQKESAYKAAAEWINVATGRGSLGSHFESALPVLSKVMYAPRYTASRIQVLNPYTYAKNSRTAEGRAVLKNQMSDMVQYTGMVSLTLALASAAGASVGFDPDDPDFLKMKFGNVRYDFLAGLQQPMRLFYRTGKSLYGRATGEKVNSRQTTLDIAGRFGRSKLAPVPSFFVDYLTGKDFTGQDFKLSKAVVDRVTPFMWRDFYQAYEKEGFGKAAMMLPGAVGVGVQNYDEKTGAVKGSTFTKAASEQGLKYDFVKPKTGEPDVIYKQRVERVEKWMEDYGKKLIEHPRYKSMSAEDQKAAVENLRRRIGRQQNAVKPNMKGLEPGAVLLGVKKSAARKPGQDRKKLWVAP